jgi:hypothetical protein
MSVRYSAIGELMPDRDQVSADSHLDLENRVRRRAHELWLSHKDKNSDTALQDWLQAEREILGTGLREEPVQNRATVIGDARRPDMSRINKFGEA